MRQIDINQAKIHSERLFQAALNGDEVIITQDNQPILKLVRVVQSKKYSQSGSSKRYSLEELVKGISPENLYSEFNSGVGLGNEFW